MRGSLLTHPRANEQRQTPPRLARAWGFAAVLALSASLAGGCDDTIIGQPLPSFRACDRTPALTWENFGRPYLEQHCNGCHSAYLRENQRNYAPMGIDFDTWDDAVFWHERLEARGVTDQSMPPGGGPGTDERELLREWVRCELTPAARLGG